MEEIKTVEVLDKSGNVLIKGSVEEIKQENNTLKITLNAKIRRCLICGSNENLQTYVIKIISCMKYNFLGEIRPFTICRDCLNALGEPLVIIFSKRLRTLREIDDKIIELEDAAKKAEGKDRAMYYAAAKALRWVLGKEEDAV